MSSDIALTEQADLDFSAGRLERALAAYTALLRADPSDSYAWYRTALSLSRLGNRGAGQQALQQAWEALAEAGQLLLAVAAAADMSQLDPEAGHALVGRLAALYGAGAPRVDRECRLPPPPNPRPVGDQPVPEGEDLRVLCSTAVEACGQAYEHFLNEAAKGQALPFHPLLGDLPAEDFVEFLPLMKSHVMPAGRVVIEQGTEGSSMFVVARGRVEVSQDGTHLAYLRTGSFFGEMALLTHSTRAARVVCSTPVLLFEIDAEALDELAEGSPEVARVLAQHTRQRLLRNLMATSPLFHALEPSQRAELIDLFTTRVWEEGQTLIEEGGESDGLQLILSGSVVVSKDEGGEPMVLAELGPGDLFGEISLIQRRSATARVAASSKSVVLCLPRDVFNAHVADYPQALAHVYKVAVQREEANKRLQEALHIAIDQDEDIFF